MWKAPVFYSCQLVAVMLCTLVLFFPVTARSAEIKVAVASNFQHTMKSLTRKFESESGHRVILISGSSGKLFAQIENGAPFDLFFSADEVLPRRLEQVNLAISGSRFTYAIGKLVLWSPQAAYVDDRGDILGHGDFHHLAIANPRLAPYGRAARQVLEARNLWDKLSGRLVRGENVTQAFQFVASGNAELGFVAYAQILQSQALNQGSWWPVPSELHKPIIQQAVILADLPATRDFVQFTTSSAALQIIREDGYAVP